jgi:hypothetical protein
MGNEKDFPGCNEAEGVTQTRHYCADVKAVTIEYESTDADPS